MLTILAQVGGSGSSGSSLGTGILTIAVLGAVWLAVRKFGDKDDKSSPDVWKKPSKPQRPQGRGGTRGPSPASARPTVNGKGAFYRSKKNAFYRSKSKKGAFYKSKLPNVMGVAGGLSSFSGDSNSTGSEGEVRTACILDNMAKSDPLLTVAHGAKFNPRGTGQADMDHVIAKGKKVVMLDSKLYTNWDGPWTLQPSATGKGVDIVNDSVRRKNAIPSSADCWRKYLPGAKVSSMIVMHNGTVNPSRNYASGVRLVSAEDLESALKKEFRGESGPTRYRGKIHSALKVK